MLTTAQAGHFTTFGFAVLRGFLADRAAVLRAEVNAAIRDAYAATYDERVIDGISGHYLPMASRLTPVSASLACDDPRLIDAAGQLLGGPVIPECPEGVLYFAEAGWHNDDGIGVHGVKFAAYFDQLTAANGALRLVPGSHHPEQQARLAAWQRSQPPVSDDASADAYRDSFPGYIAETSPGDVIAFDLHTWHASFCGAGWPGPPFTSAARIPARNGTGHCGRPVTASSRHSAASTAAATRYGGTGSAALPGTPAGHR